MLFAAIGNALQPGSKSNTIVKITDEVVDRAQKDITLFREVSATRNVFTKCRYTKKSLYDYKWVLLSLSLVICSACALCAFTGKRKDTQIHLETDDNMCIVHIFYKEYKLFCDSIMKCFITKSYNNVKYVCFQLVEEYVSHTDKTYLPFVNMLRKLHNTSVEYNAAIFESKNILQNCDIARCTESMISDILQSILTLQFLREHTSLSVEKITNIMRVLHVQTKEL